MWDDLERMKVCLDLQWYWICCCLSFNHNYEYICFFILWTWNLNVRKCWQSQGKIKVLLDACLVCSKCSPQWLILQPLQDSLSRMTKDSKPRHQQKQMASSGDINSKMSTLTVRPWQKPYEATQHNYEVQMYKSNFPTLLLNFLCVYFGWGVCVCLWEL